MDNKKNESNAGWQYATTSTGKRIRILPVTKSVTVRATAPSTSPESKIQAAPAPTFQEQYDKYQKELEDVISAPSTRTQQRRRKILRDRIETSLFPDGPNKTVEVFLPYDSDEPTEDPPIIIDQNHANETEPVWADLQPLRTTDPIEQKLMTINNNLMQLDRKVNAMHNAVVRLEASHMESRVTIEEMEFKKIKKEEDVQDIVKTGLDMVQIVKLRELFKKKTQAQAISCVLAYLFVPEMQRKLGWTTRIPLKGTQFAESLYRIVYGDDEEKEFEKEFQNALSAHFRQAFYYTDDANKSNTKRKNEK